MYSYELKMKGQSSSSSSSPKDKRFRDVVACASFLTVESFSLSSGATFSRLLSRPVVSEDGLLTELRVLATSFGFGAGFRYLYLPGVLSFKSGEEKIFVRLRREIECEQSYHYSPASF